MVVNFSSFVALLTSALCRSVEILIGKKRDIVAAGWVQLMTSRKGSCQYQRIRNIEKKQHYIVLSLYLSDPCRSISNFFFSLVRSPCALNAETMEEYASSSRRRRILLHSSLERSSNRGQLLLHI